MSGTRLAALVLIIGGILCLVYGGFTYTKDTHKADIGPIELSVEEKETVSIPVWLGAGALIAGVLLLVVRVKKGP
jgi:TRAP-type C4-dicarboxylate transport system permease small subunit